MQPLSLPSPKTFLYLLTSFSSLPYPSTLPATNLSSIPMNSSILDISLKCSHTIRDRFVSGFFNVVCFRGFCFLWVVELYSSSKCFRVDIKLRLSANSLSALSADKMVQIPELGYSAYYLTFLDHIFLHVTKREISVY